MKHRATLHPENFLNQPVRAVPGVLIALCCAVPASVFAAPPATSAYYTDPQNSYVRDETSNKIDSVNMIACYIAAMSPAALVNKGSYIALVDDNVCNSKGGASNSAAGASASQAPSYQPAIVTSTRTSNSDPMRVTVWLDQHTGSGSAERININLSVTAAPSATSPYGTFRLDFCGATPGGSDCLEQGLLSADATGVSFYQTSHRDGPLQSTALTLNAAGSTSGSGEMLLSSASGSQQYNFAYNAGLFRRSDGNSDVCFSRDASDPTTGFAVNQYGLYDASSGARINLNSGFPIDFTTGGTTYHLYASYWGLNIPPEVAPLLTNGATVQKVDYSGGSASSTDYTLVLAAGKLTRYSKQSTTLNALDQIRLDAFVQDASGFYPNAASNQQYEMYWDEASGKFHVTGVMSCSSNGCNLQPLPAEELVDGTFWASLGGLSAWSQSFGGQLFVKLAGATDPIASLSVPVLYYSQDLVYPAELPQTLYCISNCPTAASLVSYFAAGSHDLSPYGTTFNNGTETPAAGVTTYTTSSSTALLMDGAGQKVTFADAAALANQPQYMGGINSGRLFTNLAAAQCADNATLYCDSQTASLDTYYTWQTGVNPWDQFSAVKDNTGALVKFDAPLLVKYVVPSGAIYGSYAGKSLVLQYGGFGQLWGIPGTCVDQSTNAVVACNTPNAQNVGAFMIPDDLVTGVVTSGANSYLVKWQQREIRFAQKDLAVCLAAALALPIGVSLPAASGLQSTIDPNSPIYIGAEPTVTTAPRVIQGVVEY
jgi:hypothetical protein